MLRARHLRTGAIAMASNGRKNSSEWEIITLQNFENEEVTLVPPAAKPKPKAKAKAKKKAAPKKAAPVAAIPVAAAPTDDDMDGLLDELDT